MRLWRDLLKRKFKSNEHESNSQQYVQLNLEWLPSNEQESSSK